jgi:hypothetical protein
MGIKLIHGLKDGKVVKVTDVDNGLKCKCVCLDCRSPLMAINNKENLRRPHFRHYSIKDSKKITACKASEETAIHYLAKNIIEKMKFIILPAYEVQVERHNGRGTRIHTIKKQRRVNFDYIQNENSISTSQGYRAIKPDLIAYSGNRRLFIEVAVFHPCDDEKIDYLKKYNVSAIEIDLSKFPRTAKEEDLEKYLAEGKYLKANGTKWLYHVENEKYHQEALKLEEEIAKRAAYFAEKEERERKARAIEEEKKRKEFLRSRFRVELWDVVLNSYKGNLFCRIEQFIKSKYGDSIDCYSRKDYPYIEHEIEGLEDILICATDDGYQIECEFLELDIVTSIEDPKSYEELGYSAIAKIYYEANKILCNGLEEAVLQKELERQLEEKKAREEHEAFLEKKKQEWNALRDKQEKELEEKRQQEVIEQRIREEHRRNAEEQQRKENEKRKIDEEKLVYDTILKILQEMKKREIWKKDHPVIPSEVIKRVKIQIAGFNNARFIDVRRRLQTKGQLHKVDENKLLTAVIVK